MIAIDSQVIKNNLRMSDAINAMEDLYRNGGSELAVQPMRTLNRIDEDSLLLTMPSHSRKLKRFAVKIVSEFRSNPKRFSLPVQGGVIVLIDAENSKPLAILDSAAITAIRTGAVSGLATKLLSRRDSRSVALVGSGQQARTLVEAICTVRGISEVRVFSKNYVHAKLFAKEMTVKLEVPIKPHEKRSEALKNSDIVVLATNSSSPVIDWTDISEGSHINSIGTLPDRRELDRKTVCNSKLYVDSRDGVLKEAGDVMEAIRSGKMSEKNLIGDLHEVITGKCEGRKKESEVTLFKSVGIGLQDVYASDRVYNKVALDPDFIRKNSIPHLQ
jgi:alanine dehydrogenase